MQIKATSIQFSGLDIRVSKEHNTAQATLHPSSYRVMQPGEIRLNGQLVSKDDETVKAASQCLYDRNMPWAVGLQEILLKGILKAVLDKNPAFKHDPLSSKAKKTPDIEDLLLVRDLADFGNLDSSQRENWVLNLKNRPYKPGVS